MASGQWLVVGDEENGVTPLAHQPPITSHQPLLLLTLALCVALVGSQAFAAGPKTPNVLVICADDHAAYVTGVYGNKLVRTPNIDRLAARGIRFERAYCNSPVCTASRQSILTGRYPRTIGVTRLETALSDSEVTMAETLGRAGFETAAIGKMHFNSELAHGFELRVDQPQYRSWLRGQAGKSGGNGATTDAARGEGDSPILSPGQDKIGTVPSGRIGTVPGQAVQPPWRPFKDPGSVWLNAACLPVGQTDAQMDGTYFAQQAAAYIERARDKPFFLMVSFYEPHSPFRFPLEYRGRHQGDEFAVPKVGPEDEEQIPAVFRGLTDGEKQGIAAAYTTSVEFMDKNVGLVLAALDRSGQADDTIVVYLSDHGYMLGQHGRFEKHSSYEPAVRAPLVIRYPRRIGAGRISHAFVELVDLVPTIYNLCDFPAPAPLQGRSLIELLMGKTTRHRDHVIVEYAPNEEVMVRDEYWKLVYEAGTQRRTDGYDTGRPLAPNRFRLYDMFQDPEEMHNVAANPANAETLKRLTNLLVDHLSVTARQVELVPLAADPLTVLSHCVQSRDVPKPGKRE